MPAVEFYDRLAEYALGWLGWTEDAALAADVNAILVGYAGKVAMLNAVFGSGEPSADELPAFTPDAMRGLSRRP